jgi:hypothetical protein
MTGHIADMVELRKVHNFLVENVKHRDLVGDLDIGCRIVLK